MWEITRNDGRSRSIKVTDFGTDRKLICDFLLLSFYVLSLTVDGLLLHIGQIILFERGCLYSTPSFWAEPLNCRLQNLATKTRHTHRIVGYSEWLRRGSPLRQTDKKADRQNYDSNSWRAGNMRNIRIKIQSFGTDAAAARISVTEGRLEWVQNTRRSLLYAASST